MRFYRILILIAILFVVLSDQHVDKVSFKKEDKREPSQISDFFDHEPFHPALLRNNYSYLLHQSSDVSQSCSDDFTMYMLYVYGLIKKLSTPTPMWVLELLDATGKPGPGILEGGIQWLGSFTECLKVQVPKYQSTEIKFKGQYCTAMLSINSLGANSESPLTTNPVQQMFRTILNNVNPPGLFVMIGLCLPSSCTALELTELLNDTLATMSLTGVTIAPLEEEMCWTAESNVYGTGTIIVICLFAAFALLLTIGTFYEMVSIRRRRNKDYERTFERVLLSFSIYKNGRKILDTSHGEGTLTCLHGIRFLSMAWVVLGHTYGFAMMLPFKNWADVPSIMRDLAFDIIQNGTFSVDTFFFLSGFLVAYLFLKEMKKPGSKFGLYKIFLFYFHRYWRLTPALAMAVAFLATLYKYLTNGPIWNFVNSMFVDQCHDNWWATLLYIQNLYKPAHMCFSVSWYLACDMQFYAISLLILYPLYRFKNIGLAILGAFFVASMLIPGLIIHMEDLPVFISANPQSVIAGNDQKQMDFQADVYIKPWCRMGPYIVGIILAVVLHRTTLKVKLQPIVVAIGWLLSTVLGLTIVFGTHDYFTGDSVMSNGLNSFYGACSRPAWAIVVAWVVFACVTGHGGFVNTLLSWKALIPLSRLTYTTYLIHLYLVISFYGTQQSVFYFNHYLETIIYLGILIMSIAVAFISSLAFEAPMIELEKIFLPRKINDAPPCLNAAHISTSHPKAPDQQVDNSSIQEKAYQNEGFERDNGIDSETHYRVDVKPVTTL